MSAQIAPANVDDTQFVVVVGGIILGRRPPRPGGRDPATPLKAITSTQNNRRFSLLFPSLSSAMSTKCFISS